MDFTKLTSYIDSLWQEYGVPSADIIITHEHETVLRHMTGYADPERTQPISPKHMYNMCSATKVVTMTAMMQLYEKGLFKMEDPVSLYLPEYANLTVKDPVSGQVRPAKNVMRMEHLFRMGGGLSYDTDCPEVSELLRRTEGNPTTRQLIGALASRPLTFEPGEDFLYSMCHDVLAAVLEVISGKRYSEYLQENIFTPLGMKDATFHLRPEDRNRLPASWWHNWDTRKFELKDGDHVRFGNLYESGGGGLVCTVDDYILFADALANGGVGKNGYRVLSQEGIDMLRTPHTFFKSQESFAKMKKPGYRYGLGVRTLTDGRYSASPVGEFGWDGAAGAYVAIDPKNHLAIFYAQHTYNFLEVYEIIHPRLRDLTYECMGL